MPQAQGVVLLSKDAYNRLLHAQNTTQPRHSAPTVDAFSQTEDDTSTHDTSPITPSVLTIKEVVSSIPKYFQPACLKVLKCLPELKICSDGFICNPEYTAIDGISLKSLLSGTCVPFAEPPGNDVVEFLKEKGVTKFRNHRINHADQIDHWVSPYKF